MYFLQKGHLVAHFLRQIYVISMVLELIHSKFPVIWWLNQVSMICNEGVMRLTKSVKFNLTATFIRELRVWHI